MLIGAAGATAVLLVTGLPGQPVHHYTVSIYLEHDVTPDQKAAIEAALPAFKPTNAIRFETREEAFRHFQEMTKDYPDLRQSTKAEDMPESFTLETKGRLFDCTGYAKVRHMPGVDQIQVVQQRVTDYGAKIICDAEYAKP
ncbi:hypothetical protein Rhe02_06980 [Rhizocola hellebori]|uniref:FtsX extracellular domain-containing protein n=2 Tax=Rhizocola hellebori TaxID=1392758 RepID=A0A8J3Q3C1_9ACTN|nr:hypothetical protein Rhe02_06980 [Rhizocola hellebori]